jgi:methylthioribose-1-phosphate isomerase
MREPIRPVTWTGSAIRVIDQTALPARLVMLDLDTVDAVVDAISRLAVRGAPQLGVIGAIGVVVALDQAARERWDPVRLDREIQRIREARPTAVNLAWGVDQVADLVGDGRSAVLARALAILDADARGNRAMGVLGADWIQARVARGRVRALTHCNAGALATAGWGTALGVLRELHARGALELVHVDETRPLLQGARLTAWELARDGIPFVLQADSAAASAILGRLVDVAVVGADRIAANGDTANKVGTLGVALAARDAGIPFLVAAPRSTIDRATADGSAIVVEQRGASEVTSLGAVVIAPDGAGVWNPAFDVTPARLISAIVTEAEVIEVAAGQVP